MREINTVIRDMPIQLNSDKPVGKITLGKNRHCTQETDNKFSTYLDKLLNNESRGIDNNKEDKIKVDTDKITDIEDDLMFFLVFADIIDENKEHVVESDLTGVIKNTTESTSSNIKEIEELVLSVEERPDFRTEDILSDILTKLKEVKLVLENFQDESTIFSEKETGNSAFEIKYGKEVRNQLNRLLTELDGKNATEIDAISVPESTKGLRDLMARLTRLEIHLQNLLKETESNEPINLKNNISTYQDANLSTNSLDTVTTIINKRDGKLSSIGNGRKIIIENKKGIFEEDRVLVELSRVSQNEVEEINIDESDVFSNKKEYNSKKSNTSFNFVREEEVEMETKDINNQYFAVNDQKSIQRTLSSKTADVYQLNQRDIYEQIDKHIHSVIRNGQNRIEIQLEPETLGKVNLKLKLEDGKVSVNFNVDNNIVKEQLEQNLPLLKQNFLRLGYNVDHIQVETEEQKTAFHQEQHQQSSPEQQEYNMNGQQQKPHHDGPSSGELYQLFLELDDDTENTIWRWYQYKYGYLSMNMNYLA